MIIRDFVSRREIDPANIVGGVVQMPGFNYSGIASLDDLDTELWKSLFSRLESVQETFVAARPHVPEYPWVRDPLHTCTRVWEYPFALYHIEQLVQSRSWSAPPVIVDLGSGATFFPFAVAQLGCRVLAADADQTAKLSLDRAIGKIPTGSGEVACSVSDARSLNVEDESVDCVYCISVLEHIPNFERVISEAARVLRQNGTFVLTFDIDLRGNFDIGPEAYGRLMEALRAAFSFNYPERIVHPRRMLTSDNSIYPMYPRRSRVRTIAGQMKSAAKRLVSGRAAPERLLVSTYGACMTRRSL